MIGVPAGISSTEKRAVIQSGISAGAKDVLLLKSHFISDWGWHSYKSSFGHMIVDIGGGTCEVAVISLGGIVTAESLRIAGDVLDEVLQSISKKNII